MCIQWQFAVPGSAISLTYTVVDPSVICLDLFTPPPSQFQEGGVANYYDFLYDKMTYILQILIPQSPKYNVKMQHAV